MSTYNVIRKSLIGTSIGAFLLLGSVIAASAQNADQQYRQLQRAQAEAAQREQDYLRTRNMRDYREWQRAQARAQRELADYQNAQNRGGYYNNRYDNYNNGSYNNRYNTYNNGYTTVYNNGYNNGSYSNNGMYRVYRNGSYYDVNAREAEMLRQAVRTGYEQGYRQGQVDRRYRRGFNYGNSRTYMTGTYGWSSAVPQDQYQYYFQQGFQRGYEDGYNNTNRYGVRSSNGFNILGGVLNTILNISNP